MSDERINYTKSDDAAAAPVPEFAARFLIEWGLQQMNELAYRLYDGEEVRFGAIAVRCEDGTQAWEAAELVEKILCQGANPDWPMEFKADYNMTAPHARAILLYRLKDQDFQWPSDEEIQNF